MSAEDFIKNQLRSDIRAMQVNYINYEITKRNLVLNVRLKDQAFEQIIAPPQAATAQELAQSANAATQTTNLINFQNTLFASEAALITDYETYELARLTVYRDIGILPYDEWEAFSEIFPESTADPASAPAPSIPTENLPPLRRPSHRRASAGKVIAVGLACLLALGGVTVLSVPGLSKPIRGFFTDYRPGYHSLRGQAGGPADHGHRQGSPGELEESGRALPGRGVDNDHHDPARGHQGQEGRPRLRARLGGAERQLDQPEDHHQEGRGLVSERQADPRGRRDRGQGIRGRHLHPGQGDVEGEIKLAESDLARSADRVDWAVRMFEKGYVSKAAKVSEELNFKKAKFALEQAESKKKVLVDYTKGKTIKELQSEVEKARSDELAKEQTLQLEKNKEAKLEKQIVNCKLFAPVDGIVVYANDPTRSFGSNAASDRGRGGGPRAAEDLQPAGHHPDAGQHQGPRVADRQDHAGHEGEDPGRCLLRDRARRHGARRGAPARPEQLSSARTSRSTPPGQDRQPAAGPAAGHERRGDDPGRSQGERAQRPGPGDHRVQRQGPRCHQDRRAASSAARSSWASPTTSSSRSPRASPPAPSSPSTR